MNGVETTDAQAAAVQKTPHRVSLDSIRAKVADELIFRPQSHPTMTIVVMTMQNGFVVIGKSAPADPANFNEGLGIDFAREDCIRQLWPLEGYLLREKLHNQQAEGTDQ